MSRRAVLAGGAALGTWALAGGTPPTTAADPPFDGSDEAARLRAAYDVRVKAAALARDRVDGTQATNGDEDGVERWAAAYSKGLPHGRDGEVNPKAYPIYLRAVRSGRHQDFEAIPLGGFVKLANPQAAWAFDLVGPDATQPVLPPPPRFSSDEQAAELAELYWQALTRDIPFAEYDRNPVIAKACDDLSHMPAFKGPRRDGHVTPDVLFRGTTRGDLIGPYVSQFLLLDLPILPIRVEQRIRTAAPGVDYMTTYDEWLAIQDGKLAAVNTFDAQTRYLRNGRDLGEYVHRDFTYQGFLGACLLALRMGTQPDGANPYKHSRTQSGFTTFGQPYLIYLIAVVTQAALKACWYQKWRVHRRLRPEELAGRVDNHVRGVRQYPLHQSLLDSGALAAVRAASGSALLPQAYPEGCPTHPAYPAGHAVIAGACATVLKTMLDESHVIPEPMQPSADGLTLTPWKGADLTVGNELDKLACNIAMGRNIAGIHWRTDCAAGLALGEDVALAVLDEMRLTGNELYTGCSLRRFDGRTVRAG
ncbi:MAG TPA: vanadium-dependent haloperoxidase [Candidatus Binatia bacterium]|jgi:hypothetical protein|nr:vanadium-dependent haloperoxidase [Candidatus Binatia bacterium]